MRFEAQQKNMRQGHREMIRMIWKEMIWGKPKKNKKEEKKRIFQVCHKQLD